MHEDALALLIADLLQKPLRADQVGEQDRSDRRARLGHCVRGAAASATTFTIGHWCARHQYQMVSA
jgi:hypothetical protein